MTFIINLYFQVDRIVPMGIYFFKSLKMKRIFLILTVIGCFSTSCGSKKGYLDRNDADKSLQEAVKKLNKNGDDQDAKDAIPVLYKNIKTKHLDNINAYGYTQQLNKWDKIIDDYEYLQATYDAIINSPAAFRLVTPESYSTQLVLVKDSAAEAYYALGNNYIDKTGRDNAKQAYLNFKKATKYVAGYKDANDKMQQAYQNAMVNVVINPVQENTYFSQPGWSGFGRNYSNEYFQQNLLRDLSYSNRYAAKFFNQREARALDVKADWIVDFRLRNLDVPPPVNSYSQRSVSKQIQIGTDTAGRPVYKTVNANINTTRENFTARADMEMSVTEWSSRKSIAFQTYTEYYKWQQETATFSGDQRALSTNDWNIINNTNNNIPNKEQILTELYRKIYPRVLVGIRNAVDW